MALGFERLEVVSEESNGVESREPAARETNHEADSRVESELAVQQYILDASYTSSGLRTLMVRSSELSPHRTFGGNPSTRLYTAPMAHMSQITSSRRAKGCVQLLVRGIVWDKTIALLVRHEYTIGTIKELIRRRIGLPHAEFGLIFSGHVLRATFLSLEELDIMHDATLTCVSFRLNCSHSSVSRPSTSIHSTSDIQVNVKFLFHAKVALTLKEMASVLDLQKMVSEYLSGHSPGNVLLIFCGQRLLEKHLALFDYGIRDGASLHAVLKY